MAPSAVDDFHPPYHLGAFGCALVGVWSGSPHSRCPALDLGGFEPIRFRGHYLGAAFVLRYDRPTADHPVAYSEVILAYVVRRWTRWAAVPFDLVLDDPFYVDAGRHHYHLPKRLDSTLRIDVERDAAGAPRRMTASGSDVAFDAALRKTRVPCVPGLASTLLRVSTDHVPVVGTAGAPLLRSLIQVHPDAATAHAAYGARLSVGGRTLRPMGALFWQSLAITVGIPTPLASC